MFVCIRNCSHFPTHFLWLLVTKLESWINILDLRLFQLTFIILVLDSCFDCRRNVVACAKHFVGDGGTDRGTNEGNTISSFVDLERIHMRPYLDCLAQGVSTVMASYTSWNGSKLHSNRFLLTHILKEKLNFKVLTNLVLRPSFDVLSKFWYSFHWISKKKEIYEKMQVLLRLSFNFKWGKEGMMSIGCSDNSLGTLDFSMHLA